MKAISIKQPWASLIAHGIKDIENRTWKCPQKYIGKRVLIHASMKSANFWDSHLATIIDEFIRKISKSGTDWSNYPNGAIIGSVKIVDCVQNHPSIWAEKGVYNWVLAEPILYEYPIENVKGKLSFWDYKGIEERIIECPECGIIQIAVADHTTVPFSTFIHDCKNCGFVIMEQDWCEVKEDKK